MNDVGELLRMCAEIGYRISLNGDKIRFDFIGETMPPDAVIAPLVNSLKERKLEVIEFLRQGESVDFDLLFKQAAHEIAGKYTGGEIAFTRENRPELFHDSLAVENRLNKYWGNDPHGFQQAIVEWKEIQLEMVKLYKDSQKYLCASCGKPGERLMLNTEPKYQARWYCLKCKPYRNI